MFEVSDQFAEHPAFTRGRGITVQEPCSCFDGFPAGCLHDLREKLLYVGELLPIVDKGVFRFMGPAGIVCQRDASIPYLRQRVLGRDNAISHQIPITLREWCHWALG